MPEPDLTQLADAINRCVSLGRYADALSLSGQLVESYVPRGDDLAKQILLESTRFYSDAGRIPELNERATGLLRRMIQLAPRHGETTLEWAVCAALMGLSDLYTFGRNAGNNVSRTRASIGVCDEVIERWLASRDAWLRFNVAGTMINKAISLMEIGEETAARREYARVVESFAGDAANGDNDRMAQRVSVARHAMDVLDTVRIPEPEFKTEYLTAMRRRAERTGQWVEDVAPRDYVAQLVELASRIHHATTNLVRRQSCSGEPIVLLLRNFELMETSAPNIQSIRFPAGLRLVDRLSELTELVQVANTKAAALEIDGNSMSALGRRPDRLRLLYLPDTGWADVVGVLISLAEHIVVWAGEKTPGVLRELELIIELGRVGDTTVLLDGQAPAPPGLRDVLGPPRDTLRPDDPVLAGFPVVLRAEDMGEPMLHTVIDPVTAVRRLPMEERVARVRHRLDAARRR